MNILTSANSGVRFEEKVADLLEMFDFKGYYCQGAFQQEFGVIPPRYYIRNATYNSLLTKKGKEYGVMRQKGKTDFKIVSKKAKETKEFPDVKKGLDLRIECKYQNVKGSAEFKLPWTVMNLQYGPLTDSILIAEGAKFDPVLLKIIKEMCSEKITWTGGLKESRKVHLMDFEQFQDWCNRAFN